MAYDKLIDSVQLDSDLTAIANAIRGKTGKTAKLGIDEMPLEIASIETGAAPTTVEQATPTISVSTAGKITATSKQTEGYVTGGTKTATKQLSTQAAKTVTPTTSNQTAVSSGKYTTGAITVKGDANLLAENIAKGVSIFGIIGTLNSAKVATGTFMGTGMYISDTPWVKITGLPFEPSRVVFFGENQYDHGIIFADSEGYTDGYAFCHASGYDEEYDDYWDYLTTETSKFHLILNSDGFQVNTDGMGTDHSLWLPSSTTYHYIAIC